MSGIDIHFEGPDGCGKGIQLTELYRRLRKDASLKRVIRTEEPWPGDETASLIRDALDRDQPTIAMSPETMQRAFIRNRLAHNQRLVIPKLEDGHIVLQDRSWVSTICYLAATSDRSYEEARDWVVTEHQNILGDLWIMPDAILVFMVSPEVALERMLARGRKLESFDKKIDLQRRVFAACQQFVDDPRFDTARFSIDGEQDVAAVHRDVLKSLEGILKLEREL